MDVQEKLYTVEEYWEIAQLPENENTRLELVEGLICEMPPSSQVNTVIAAKLVYLLGNYVCEHELGYVTGANGGF